MSKIQVICKDVRKFIRAAPLPTLIGNDRVPAPTIKGYRPIKLNQRFRVMLDNILSPDPTTLLALGKQVVRRHTMRHQVHEQRHTRTIICTEHIPISPNNVVGTVLVMILTHGLVHGINVGHKQCAVCLVRAQVNVHVIRTVHMPSVGRELSL